MNITLHTYPTHASFKEGAGIGVPAPSSYTPNGTWPFRCLIAEGTPAHVLSTDDYNRYVIFTDDFKGFVFTAPDSDTGIAHLYTKAVLPAYVTDGTEPEDVPDPEPVDTDPEAPWSINLEIHFPEVLATDDAEAVPAETKTWSWTTDRKHGMRRARATLRKNGFSITDDNVNVLRSDDTQYIAILANADA